VFLGQLDAFASRAEEVKAVAVIDREPNDARARRVRALKRIEADGAKFGALGVEEREAVRPGLADGELGELRGLPVVGSGRGAIAGTSPESALLAKERRRG
jgi:hypothetical protein